ncbi:MAG: sterol desaturase family protein, partial [Actinomycetota bacterium]
VGKALIGLAAAAGVATTIADRRRRRDPDDEAAATVSRYGGPTAIVAGGVALTTALGSATRPKRLWERRGGGRRGRRDLGTGLAASLAALFAWDAIYYWNHRLQHEARYLWAIHVVHHSSQRYNLSTALRQPVADSLGTFVPTGALCLAGIRPELVERARGLNLIYQFWIHTDVIGRLGWFEKVGNTPSHHRVHHGANRRYIDRNHGSILIVWDRLFGTFQEEDPDEPVVYGLTKNIGTDDPRVIATHEYRDILRDVADSDNWKDRLSFVVRGPGWAYERRAEMDAVAEADRTDLAAA